MNSLQRSHLIHWVDRSVQEKVVQKFVNKELTSKVFLEALQASEVVVIEFVSLVIAKKLNLDDIE